MLAGSETGGRPAPSDQIMKRLNLMCLIATLLAASSAAQTAAGKRVLVYTRQTTSPASSYIHDNTQSSVEAIRKMGAENGFAVDASEDPGVFTAANLKRYGALIFSNTHNEAFQTDAQREAFQNYIQQGGAFVGLHAATTTEREWPFFVSLIGGKFVRHPVLQKFVVTVQDATHPSTRDLPASFEWEDECYFHDSLSPDLHPLLFTDSTKLNDPERGKYPSSLMGQSVPLAWTITTGGRRVFYTALGHKKETYSNPLLVRHILGGVLWALGAAR